MFAFAAGETDSPIKATIVLEGIPMKGTVEARRRIIRFLGVPNANHPDAPAAQEAVLDSWRMFDFEANPGFTLSLTFAERWSRRRGCISWVRSAFLVAFAFWGYSYALQPEFDVLRQQLGRPDDDLIPSTMLTSPHDAVTTRALHVITEPPWRSMVVRMGRRTLFLPWPPDPSFFDRTAEALKGLGRNFTLTLPTKSLVPWPSRPEFRAD